jgi:hypothetical protein
MPPAGGSERLALLGPNAVTQRMQAQDGPGQRAIAVLTLAFAPVKRAIPGVRLGPAGEAAFRPPASRGEGAEAQSPSASLRIDSAKGTEAI